jgi:predicted ribosomally synthesized peptide with nif11-like leader
MDKMRELYEKVAKDSALQVKFNAIISDAQKAGEAATGEKLAAFAKEAGFDATFEEMKDFFKELSEKGKGELSDTELDMVAGGKDGGDIANSVWSIGIGC